MNSLLGHIKQKNWSDYFIYGMGGMSLLCIFLALHFQIYAIALLPFVILLGFLAIVDFKKVFYFLLMMLPFSTEVFLPGGLGTDLPTEPIMILLMGVYLWYFIYKLPSLEISFFQHPLTLLLLLHLVWIIACTFNSGEPIVSIKYTIAKFWYVIAFYFVAGVVLTNPKAIRTFVWVVSIPMIITVLIITVKHGLEGFTFKASNFVVHPFYRNHVNYAAALVLFLPFVYGLRSAYAAHSWLRILVNLFCLIILMGIFLSFTRAAWLATVIPIAIGIVVKLRLTKIALALALAGALGISLYFINDNRYLEYAPTFEKAISHKEFDNLISATTSGEDVSLMERFYRWVAGRYMVEDKPLMGFGPGTFYFFYQKYTINNFETYVSDNPEKSGVHNYYLMLAVEQGFIGLGIFLLLLSYFFYRGEIVYHQTRDPFLASMVMAAMMCVAVIAFLLIVNDLIETDKVGSFFFLSFAVLSCIDLYNQRRSHLLIQNK